MIDIYTYYSVGGYKDLYIGNSDCDESVYYSPLYAVWQNGMQFDKQTVSQMEALAKLRHMEFITSGATRSIPSTSIRLETKGGYKCILAKVEGGYSLIIREIENDATDVYGRKIPFLIQFVGKDGQDMLILGRYICENITDFENFISKLFHYNAELNALECELGKLNKELKRILIEYKDALNDEGSIPARSILYMLLSDKFSYQTVAKTIGFSPSDIYKVYDYDGKCIKTQSLYQPNDFYNAHESKNTPPKVNNTNERSIDDLPPFVNTQYIIDAIKKILSSFVALTPEDNEDFSAIRQHLVNIINRKK